MSTLTRTLGVLAAAIAAATLAKHLPADLDATFGDGPAAADTTSPLPVAVEDTGAHYDRDQWPHWTNVGGGCDRREVTLMRDGHHVRRGEGCRITGGRWVSNYDGQTVTDPRRLDIDHIVPLAEVQRSGRIVDGHRVGPRRWSTEQREAYANDPAVLIAVTASSNRAKGDQDPAHWLPERDRCGYVRRWVAIKHRYELSADPAETAAINHVLTRCGGN